METEKEFSVVDLVDSDPRFKSLKDELSRFKKGSDEYFLELINSMPLSSWPKYTAFLKQQAVPLETSNKPGYSPVYRSSLSKNDLVTCMDSIKLKTFYDHFQFAVRSWPQNDCLGVRPYDESSGQWLDHYEFEDYATVNERSRNIGSGIMTLVNTKRLRSLTSNDFIVSILSFNRPEWVLTDLACQQYSLTNTALYETLGPETSEYIMNLTESPVLLFAKSNMYRVMEIIPKLKFVNTLVVLEDIDNEELKIINDSIFAHSKNSLGEKVSLFSLRQVEEIGKLNQIPVIPPTPDSLYTISFTSGTTGMPKGVEMTHRNVASGIAFAFSTFRIPKHKRGKQLHDMCFLPLAHIFERMLLAYNISSGFGLGFLHKPDPAVLVEDLKILKPDVVSLVPRVLTKFEAGIKNALEKSGFQKNVASNIIEMKQTRITSKGGPDRSLMNYLIYHRVLIDKIRESLGLENASYMVTGSAPISYDTLVFLKSSLDIGMRQGFGMTESFAGVCLSEPHEKDAGSCGAIGISSECRLKSVPSMGYDAEKDLKGELQLRGPQIFKRYFKREDVTTESFDEEGWFSTGDVGRIDEKGRLYVIDRVKNFFKLAQGEYIAPEKIENSYLSSCPLITQIFVFGDSLQTYLVGVVGIDPDMVQQALIKENPSVKNMSASQLVEALNSDSKLRKQLLSIMNTFIKGLQGFEKVHNIYVGLEPLRVEDDVVTPTFKIKRPKATKFFKDQLDALYAEGSIIKNGNL
ncbi:hypothetical protein Kpol_401p1 [Vanderwaltozyma polyspora DSM 70294]|uniref:AMP-dependent synthetase/ligase domain-containing protein n=1 Tax=Vanderwaltozyma polyspora (strain ATCC 22028 / DSM 70294 / BCRC 21397 / CBS 2163 / NBRC 10782 / NRRL Y-8283 / UCD 57-17) TaxID=436907 RepID=A7TRA0_VANPO|nr:uncharacterized protein Kpol_401p1 [Vanderwaltozyma polyspora DSM 70294]EDO15196.1 hypothetical protein Kpol_401p1 [Vanderwaltozyma polyspora DSM 70294]